MWLLVVCATDVWAAGTPADSAWVQDTGGVSYRAALTTPDTSDTGEDSADSADSGDSADDTGAPPDTDTDPDTDEDTDTDEPSVVEDDDVGCCGSGGSESSAILGVGLALAVVMGRRRRH